MSEKDKIPEEIVTILKPAKQGKGLMFWIPKKMKGKIDPDYFYECTFKPLHKDPSSG